MSWHNILRKGSGLGSALGSALGFLAVEPLNFGSRRVGDYL